MSYVSPVAQHARVLEHQYGDASDDRGAYEADQIGRQAVTVALMADEKMCDLPFWLWSDESNNLGLDPWTLCDSVDPRVNGESVDIWLKGGRNLNVEPTTRVFAQSRDLIGNGFVLPTNLRGSPKLRADASAVLERASNKLIRRDLTEHSHFNRIQEQLVLAGFLPEHVVANCDRHLDDLKQLKSRYAEDARVQIITVEREITAISSYRDMVAKLIEES